MRGAQHHGELTLGDILESADRYDRFVIGAVDYAHLPIAPDTELPCVSCGFYLGTDGDERFAILLRGPAERDRPRQGGARSPRAGQGVRRHRLLAELDTSSASTTSSAARSSPSRARSSATASARSASTGGPASAARRSCCPRVCWSASSARSSASPATASSCAPPASTCAAGCSSTVRPAPARPTRSAISSAHRPQFTVVVLSGTSIDAIGAACALARRLDAGAGRPGGRRPDRRGPRLRRRRTAPALPGAERDGRPRRRRRRGLPPHHQPRRPPRTGARPAPRPRRPRRRDPPAGRRGPRPPPGSVRQPPRPRQGHRRRGGGPHGGHHRVLHQGARTTLRADRGRTRIGAHRARGRPRGPRRAPLRPRPPHPPPAGRAGRHGCRGRGLDAGGGTGGTRRRVLYGGVHPAPGPGPFPGAPPGRGPSPACLPASTTRRRPACPGAEPPAPHLARLACQTRVQPSKGRPRRPAAGGGAMAEETTPRVVAVNRGVEQADDQGP